MYYYNFIENNGAYPHRSHGPDSISSFLERVCPSMRGCPMGFCFKELITSITTLDNHSEYQQDDTAHLSLVIVCGTVMAQWHLSAVVNLSRLPIHIIIIILVQLMPSCFVRLSQYLLVPRRYTNYVFDESKINRIRIFAMF